MTTQISKTRKEKSRLSKEEWREYTKTVWQIANVSDPEHPAVVRYTMRLLYAVLPHLNRFYVADHVVSGQTLPASYYLHAGVYAAGYATVMMVLSAVIFRRREFL